MKILVNKDDGIGIHGVIVVFHVEEVKEPEFLNLVSLEIPYVTMFQFWRNLVIQQTAQIYLRHFSQVGCDQ